MFSSEGLEGAFGGNGLDGQIINFGMHIWKATEVVDKDGGAAVALLGECPF